jgi:hypothetical protein
LNLDAVSKFRFEPVSHSYTRRDTMLYALGHGYGSDPLDAVELDFVHEKNLRTVPSMCCHVLRARPSRLLGEQAGARHRLGEDAARRAEF